MPASTSYEDIMLSMGHSKVDANLKHQFTVAIRTLSERKLMESRFSFQARLSSSDAPTLFGEMARSANIASVETLAVQIPDIVSRQDVLSLSIDQPVE